MRTRLIAAMLAALACGVAVRQLVSVREEVPSMPTNPKRPNAPDARSRQYADEEAAMPYNPDEPQAPTTRADSAASEHERSLMAIDGVVGVGATRNAIGDDAVLVYVRDASVRARLPKTVGGKPVESIVTGPIDAQSAPRRP